VTFTDFQTELYVDVFHGKKGLNPQVQPQDSKLRQTVLKICDDVFGVPVAADAQPSNNSAPTTRKYPVSDRRLQQQIENHLFQRPDAMRETAQSCVYRAKIIKARQTVLVHQYTNGTLMVQGPAPLIDEVDASIRSLLGIAPDQVLHTPQQERLAAQIRAVEQVDLGDEWIGTDEAGKGDYFGPLVGAAVLTDRATAQQLERLGVKDSNQLSDRRVTELAEQIRQVCGARASVVPLTPDVYNKLYAEFQAEGKNLNTLLAWVHARALENLLKKFPRQRITVIIDKFADERYIQSKLLAQGLFLIL
jgi:ribonuclease HIII